MTTPDELTDTQKSTIAGWLLARRGDTNPGLMFEDDLWSWDECVNEAAVRSSLQLSWKSQERPFHVGVLLENVPEYMFQLMGAALSGATIVGINSTRRGAELAGDIRRTDVDIIVTATEHLHLLEGIDHGASRVVCIDDDSWEQTLAPHRGAEPKATAEALDPSTQMLLLFTSGSTGAPKAVICSTGRFARTLVTNPTPFGADDVAYNAMPLFHGNALMVSFGLALKHGRPYAMRRKFSASGFLSDVLKFKATFFNYVGRSLAYVLAQPENEQEALSSLKFGFGTEASNRDREEFQRRYGCQLMESYGQSEGVLYITTTPDAPEGSLGKPMQGFDPVLLLEDGTEAVVATFDEHGILSNAAQAVGELVSRGAAARFEGYYKNPEASAEKIQGDDFLTGDLAYVDADGWYWFAGRTSDWLRIDSENIAAAPIERILNRDPEVAVAAVYPVPDPHTGDRVMAALQMSDKGFEEFDPKAFDEFLLAQPDLGTKARPTLVRVTRDLPVTATRKVDKPALRKLRWEGPDPIFEWVKDGAHDQGEYRLVDDARRGEILALFRQHERENFLQN